jgi:hypothetical protein
MKGVEEFALPFFFWENFFQEHYTEKNECIDECMGA